MLTKYYQTFQKYKYLLYDLISSDFKVKYRRSFLGIAWSMLNPIMMMLIMSAVFSRFMRGSDVKNFYLYLMSGQTAYVFFSDATTSANYSIIEASTLIKKVYIPKYIFPLEKVLFSFVNSLFSVLAYLIIMVFSPGIRFSFSILLFPVPMLALLLFSLGMSLILSSICVFFRDMRHLYSVLTMAWMYLTPIIYLRETMSDGILGTILVLNPLTWFVEYFRAFLYYIPHNLPVPTPYLQLNLICFGWGFIVTLFGVILFQRTQDRFILYI